MPSSERLPALEARLFAGALLAASGLQLIELLLPRIPLLPWLRPGLSWIVLLPFLLDFGVAPTLALFVARNFLSMAFGGQPASTFLISTVAGSATLLAVGGVARALVGRGWLGRSGASLLLASTFNAGQLLLVAVVLVGSTGYFSQIGPLLLWSIASGLLVARLSLGLGEGRGWEDLASLSGADATVEPRHGSRLQAVLAGVGMAASLALPTPAALAVALAAALLWGRRLAFRAILATWPFLPYLAWFHLRQPGEYLGWGGITRQGLDAFLFHTARLWAFTAFGRILTDRMPWNRVLSGDSILARGFALALPVVPRLFPASVGAARTWWAGKRPRGLHGLFEELGKRLSPSPP
ncbi:MAG: Gx transporter family protein [Fibrobacteria bacterium]|nr:Gx transporter family protein [Fibrobacteria bacterium]